MQLYTTYHLKKNALSYSLYVYIGWADSEDEVRARFSELFDVNLALDAIVLPGVSPSYDAIKPIWSPTTAKAIMAVGKDRSQFWSGSLHYGVQA